MAVDYAKATDNGNNLQLVIDGVPLPSQINFVLNTNYNYDEFPDPTPGSMGKVRRQISEDNEFTITYKSTGLEDSILNFDGVLDSLLEKDITAYNLNKETGVLQRVKISGITYDSRPHFNHAKQNGVVEFEVSGKARKVEKL